MDPERVEKRPEQAWLPRVAHCPGWDGLLAELHAELVALDPGYRVGTLQEKFGLLRFFGSYAPEAREACGALEDAASEESGRVCHLCARPGALVFLEQSGCRVLCGGCHRKALHAEAVEAFRWALPHEDARGHLRRGPRPVRGRSSRR